MRTHAWTPMPVTKSSRTVDGLRGLRPIQRREGKDHAGSCSPGWVTTCSAKTTHSGVPRALSSAFNVPANRWFSSKNHAITGDFVQDSDVAPCR